MWGVITDNDIRRVVTRNAFESGLEYQMDGRVQAVSAASDGSTIEAQVRGSGRSPYRQTIRIGTAPDGKLAISGGCTCPVGFNCKHVAAALFAYQEQNVPRFGRPAMDLPDRPGSAPVTEAPLPPDVDAWLRSLEAAQQAESDEYPPNVRKRLLYVLYQGPHSGGLVVDLHTIDLNRSGVTNGRSRRYRPPPIEQDAQLPQFLRPSDRTILRQLEMSGAPQSVAFIATLRSIIATGRGRWGEADGPVLTEGEPIRGQVNWILSDDGRQRAALKLPSGLLSLRLAAPWYADPSTGTIGPVETDFAPQLLRAILASPAMSPAIAARVRGEMSRRWPDRALPAPVSVAPPRLVDAPLQPVLQLLAGELPFDPAAFSAIRHYRTQASSGPHRLPLARLSWRYGIVTLAAAEQREIITQDGVLLQVKRDSRAERRAAERLHGLGLGRIIHHCPLPPTHIHAGDMMLVDPDPAAWFDFMLDDVPQLRDEGWLIEIAEDFPLRLASPTGDISIEIQESSGIDWFDLDLGVIVDGTRVNLVPALLKLLADPELAPDLSAEADPDDQAAPLLLPMPDGSVLVLPFARLAPILGPLLELFADADPDTNGDTIRLSRRDLGDLAVLETASSTAGITWSGGEALRALGRQLREHGSIPPCSAPAGFGAALRAYQLQGLAWLQFLRAAGFGGILADDMGLGKTVQTLAHLAVEQDAGRLDLPALVVCPTSLVPNWRAEAARFAPSLRTLILHGPARADSFAQIAAHDLVITTYPLLARDHAVLVAQHWHVMVLDEAQTIKNPLATTSKLARTFRARQRLCLSGTPLENHLGELWSLFDFLSPGFLGDRQQFGRRFRMPIEKGGNQERRARLAERIAPFLLRRTKGEVAADLPPKTEITEAIEMGEAQRGVYEGIRLAMHAKVRAAIAERGLAGSGIVILDALLKLRQACCDPRLLKLTTAKAAKAGSAKLERLLEMLPPLLEEGRRVLLFSQFTSMLALIQAELDQLAVPYVLLTGDTRDRMTPVRRFQDGHVKLFLISLKAGGVGLNLTAADTIIHYDPWWNPAVENQATDRAHRIGQTKPVFVHRLTTVGTIEEKMGSLKQRKQALADAILGATGETALALTEGDIDMLFAPLGT